MTCFFFPILFIIISRGIICFLLVLFDNLTVLAILIELVRVNPKQMQVLLKIQLIIYLEKFSKLVVLVAKLLVLLNQ
jgi:hypothetical protein